MKLARTGTIVFLIWDKDKIFFSDGNGGELQNILESNLDDGLDGEMILIGEDKLRLSKVKYLLADFCDGCDENNRHISGKDLWEMYHIARHPEHLTESYLWDTLKHYAVPFYERKREKIDFLNKGLFE